MNAGAWLGAVFGAAVLAAVLVLSAALEPDDQRDDGAAAVASTRTLPTPEATFPPGPVLSEPITLYEAPERVQRIEFAPGEVVDRPGFYYFWDVETGAVEGWGPPGNPEFPFPMFDAVSDDGRFLARIRYDEDFLLVDRATRRVYQYNEAEGWPVYEQGDWIGALVTFEDRVLFYTRAGEFMVIAFDTQEPRVVARFEHPDATISFNRRDDYFQAMFSPDGSKIALIGEDVRLFDLATEDTTLLADRPLAGQTLGLFARRRLQQSADGSFIVDVLDASGRGALGWTRYGWDGEPLGEGRVEDVRHDSVSYSPDGRYVAWTQSYLGDDTITALVVSDVSTGEPQFRVMGLNACGACTWLNDETAYGTTTVELEPQTYGAIVTLDGNIVRRQGLPRPVDVDPGSGEVRLIDLDGTAKATRAIDWNALQGITQGSLAWDEANATVRFSTPVLGRDYGAPSPLPIVPQVEFPPFSTQLTVTLDEPAVVDFDWSELYEQPDRLSPSLGPVSSASGFSEPRLVPNPDAPWLLEQWYQVTRDDGTEGWLVSGRRERSLRAEPGKRGEVIRVLEYPVNLTFLEVATVGQGTEESPDAYWRGGEVWARVRFEDGAEGWILLHALSYL